MTNTGPNDKEMFVNWELPVNLGQTHVMHKWNQSLNILQWENKAPPLGPKPDIKNYYLAFALHINEIW